MAVQLLKNREMSGLLSISDLVNKMEGAYVEYAAGNAPDHPRQRIYLETDDELSYFFNHIIGTDPTEGVLALRVDSLQKQYLDDTTVYPNDWFVGLVFLFDVNNSKLVAILDDHYPSKLRVGATSALAARYLAPPSPSRMGLFGSGEQARFQIEAFQETIGFEEIRVYSPTESNRCEFASTFDEELDAVVTAVSGPEAAVEGADVIVTATNANSPVFDGDLLDPGTHVSTTVGGDSSKFRDEVDRTTVSRADTIVCHHYETLMDNQQGNLFRLIEDGTVEPATVAELADVVSGDAQARQSEDEITYMKNNCGIGLQFAVTAAMIHEAAINEGVGRSLPEDWFMTKQGEENWSP